MRYANLTIDFVDRDFIDFTHEEHEGNLLLVATDELIAITNDIRKKLGYTDLVVADYDNEVYYSFLLTFNTTEKTIGIQAECNHGEKDDFVCYELPMNPKEKVHVMFKLIEALAREIYNS